ncbi:MAG: hypothetical protein WC781_00995 [Candidatus Pacearchaeota archaeon]|jgi:hypothetical protein
MVQYNYCKTYSQHVSYIDGIFSCRNLSSNPDIKKYNPTCRITHQICELGVNMIKEGKELDAIKAKANESGLVEKVALPAMPRPKRLSPRA